MTTKTDELYDLPLWVCDECGRLEFSFIRVECTNCAGMREIQNPSCVEMFEAIGQHFHRDTGFVRPGKDCRLHSPETRQEVFDAWNKGTLVY